MMVWLQVHYVKELAAAHAQVASELSAFRAAHPGPIMALVEAPGGAKALKAHVAPLRDMPRVDVPARGAAEAFESQAWQLDVAHDAMLWTLQWHAWLQERLQVARCALPGLYVCC
jgi:Domain of unknown function (DUF1744)